MQRVALICVGRLKEKFYADAAAEYVKRLSRFCRLQVTEVAEQRLPENPSHAQMQQALAREAEAIRGKLPPAANLAALCVEGRLYSSEELARLLAAQAGAGPLAFVIGGSWGLHDSVKAKADVRLSMSPMTFPHHLARVMLLEQIYRGFQILEGGKYHK